MMNPPGGQAAVTNHDWEVEDIGDSAFPAPFMYDVDISSTSYDTLCTCMACGLRVIASIDKMPEGEPGLPACRPATFQTVRQHDVEQTFLCALKACEAAGLPAGEAIHRDVAVAMSSLCVSASASLLRSAASFTGEAEEVAWSPRRRTLLRVLLQFVEGAAHDLENGSDVNWHDGCCENGCPEMDDSMHPLAIALKVRELMTEVDVAAVVSDVMES